MDVLIDNFVMSLDEKSNDAVSVRLKAWLDERPIEEGKLVLDFTSMPEIDLDSALCGMEGLRARIYDQRRTVIPTYRDEFDHTPGPSPAGNGIKS